MMKKFPLILVILALLLNSLNAFIINKYLFDDEKAADVSTFIINYNNSNYTVYVLNGSWIMLTKDDNVVSDEREIEAVVENYLVSNYMPTEEDIKKLENLTDIINESRNDGDKFPGFEENTCRSILGERYNKPSNWQDLYNNDIYYFYSVATCSKMGKVIGCANPEQIYDDIKGFFVASEENTDYIKQIKEKLKEINKDNVYDKLDEIEGVLDDIENNAEILEESKYRVPIGGVQECSDCFGICPPVLYNHTAIDEMRDLLGELKEKAEPLSGMGNIKEGFINEINRRVAYKEGKELEKIYRPEIEDLINAFEEKLPIINLSSRKVKDNETSKGLEELLEMKEELNNSLENYNFTNISSKISNFSKKLDYVYKKAKENLEKYREVEDIKNKIEAYLYIMENSGYSEVEDFRVEKEKLDVVFEKGVGLAALEDFRNDYDALLKKVKEVKENAKIDAVLGDYSRSIFNPFATGIVMTLDLFNYDYTNIINNIPIIAGTIAGLFIFSFAFLFASILYVIKPVIFGISLHKHNIKFLYFGFIGIIAFIGLIIGALSYFPLSGGLTNAPPDQIINEMMEYNKIYVIIDNTTPGNNVEREYCAEQIKDSFENLGKEAEVIYLNNDDMCTSIQTNESISCKTSNTPQIILRSSGENEIKGSDVGFIRLYIKGNAEYFENCMISSIIE